MTKINDTIVVRGRYSRCMEYSGFSTLEKDSCSAKSSIELNWKGITDNAEFYKKINKINEYGCGGSMGMTLKGVLKKDKLRGYGHAGSSDMELVIVEIIDLKRVKYSIWN